MKNSITTFILTLGISTMLLAQESRFFVPKEVRQAYEAGTRSMDGNPGENYWQNTVDYVIDAELDPATLKISGSAEITYHNNSPNDLPVLVIRLYHDVFKEGNKRLLAVNSDDINEGTEISSLSLQGQPVDLNSDQVTRSGTNMYVRLSEPLASNASTTMTIDWSYTIPKTLRRTGVYDSTSYHIAYWYPQVSVYDDVFGWDTMDYTFQSEFYNNLGNYDVTITAPESFNIWATGVLQNPEAIFPEKILERYTEAKTSADVVHIITDDDLDGYANRGTEWHYIADEVSDFAFSVSDHYLWDAAMQKVEDRSVLVSTVFPAGQAEGYANVTTNQQKAMKHFSEDMPGVPYPYPAFTTFIGLRGGGMEFPMMANNAGPGLGVTVHEMFHTYFPMYVRINERRFAHMDEGWAQYITQLVINRYFDEKNDPVYIGLASANGPMGGFEDLPLITSTQFMDNSNYGYASYSLPGFFYGMLHDYLGDETFYKAYKEYIQRWAKKSPTPYDFIYTMEDVSGEDLSWLFNPWFFNYGYADLAIASMKGNKMTIRNSGSRPVPLKVDVYYTDGSMKTVTKSAKIWEDNNEHTITIEKPNDVAYAMVSQGVPDEDPENNLSPSLEEIYKKMKVDEAIVGEYALDQYPISMYIEKEDGMMKMSMPQAGLGGLLMPMGNNTFRTTDGMLTIIFQKDGDAYSGAEIQVQGTTVTSKKK